MTTFNEEDRKWLYDTMQSKGVDTGSYDDFKNSLNNDEDRQWYYDKSKELGLDVGSRQDFDDMMWEKPQGKESPVQSKAQPAAGVPDGTPYSDEVMKRFNSPDNKAGNYKDLSQIAAEVAAEGGQAYTQTAGTPVADDKTPGSDLWRKRAVAIPGQNPYNGKSYGEVYDSIIQDFGKNINHPDIDPYAEARAQIIQAGITDDLKPEEADKLALDIREGYANRFAGNNAQAIVSQLPDQVPNIDQLMDGMWYNRDMQDKISMESRRLGLSHENYVNFYIKPQIAKALSDRYGYDVNSAKHIAGRLLSGEQHTMERVRQGEANEMITRYAEPLVQPYFDRVFKDADQTFDRQLQTAQGSPTGGAGATMGASLNYYHNTDPVKVWDAMKPHIEEMARDIMNQDFILEAEKRADEEGVTIDEWLKGRIEPYLLSGIQAKFEQMALEHEMPKNTMDYLMANIRQSLIGQIGNLILSSKARRRMQAEALARTEMGQGDYKPGFGARVAGGVAAMLPDMTYGGPFGLASWVSTKGVQGMAQQLIADGMRPLFARMLQSSAQGALSLGAFEAIKGGVEGGRNDNDRYDSYLEDDQRSAGEILQDIVQGAYEHGMQSGIMGATMIGGPLGQKISNGRGILANVAGWGTQVGVDAATATALNIPKLISGEISLEDLGNEFAQNVGTFAALGLNHKAKEFASLAGGGRSWNGVAFTKKDIDTLEDRWLLPFRKQIGEIEGAQNRHGLIEQSSLGINASQELRDAANSLGAEMYRDLMHSYAVPRELKVKVSQALGVPIPEYALKPEVLQLEKDAITKSVDLGWIDAMNYDHNKPGGVGDKVSNGEPLNNSELTLRLLFQDNKAFNEALLKQQSGEPLTDEEQELIAVNQNRMNQLFQEYAKEESGRLAHLFEKEHDLSDGSLARMMKDAVEGKAVDNDLLNEYENMLRQYNSELDAAEAQREARQSSSEEAPVEEAPVAETPVEEAPKVNRVEDEAPVEEVTDFTNKTTGTVMEVELIDGRKAYIKDGDPSNMDGLLSLVDEQGNPITIQDESGYTHDKFPPAIIKADDKGMPVIRESVSEDNGDASKPEEPAAASAKPGPAAEESQVEGSALSRIPVDEKGEPIWEEASVEDTVAALREEFENDKEVAEMVDDEIADLTSQLKELTKPVSGKEKKHSNMNERRKKKHAINDTQQKLDYWNQVKEAMKSAEQERPVEEPSGKPADLEPEKPLEPEQPSEPQQPEQPVAPTAEQKIAQGTVKNNIGKRFGFQNPDGTRSEIVIDNFKGDDLVTVTRQDYDTNGQPKGQSYQQDLKLTDVGNSIVNGLIKPALTTKEKLAKNFKVTVGDIPLIDVLTEAEQQQLLDLYAKNDKEAIGRLTGDLMDAHHEDLILKGRDNRNQKINQILNSNVGREKKLRQLRQLYNGDIVDSYLSDDALFPASPEEWVSELNSRVPKSGEGPLAYFSYDKDGSTVVGMQDETGFGTKSGGDNKGFSPWLAPKGKGISLQRYGELLHSQLPENLQEQYSVQDMRNAVRDVFGGAERPSDIPTMVIRRGILQAENAARRQEEQWIEGGPSFHKVSADDNSFAGRLERAKQQTNTEPTDAQKEKGNYKKGHVSFGGYDFVVENPEGSMRRGEADGKKWEQKMNNTYGYILGKYGKDGDHLDMFINDAADLDNWNGKVYVVDQVNPKTGEFDEHKVMYGFDSEAEARDAYLSNYEKGWKGLGKITGVDKETFDSWLDSSKRKRIPFAEHSIPREALAKQEKKPVTDAEIDKALMQEVMKAPAEKGVQFVTDTDKGQRVLDEANGNATLSRSKKRAIETAPLNPKEGSPADISTADGAKIQKNLESYANNLEKVVNRRKNFISEVAQFIGAKQDGSGSWYRTFATPNGLDLTFRLGNHNATVSNFDFRGEDNGISIVVSKRSNEGMKNDGSAHIIEFFYPEIALRKAYGKPLAEIVRSIKDAISTGEYKDPTGLAEREEVNADEIKQYRQGLEDAKVTDDSKIGFQKVSDADELAQLEKGPTVKRYRAMQLIDGKLYPPMSAKVDGEMREPTEIGVWEKSEERPDLVKNGKFVLNKGQKGQSNVPAAYNPYFHTSTSGLNDQFTSAYKRPELVVVEVEIPESELTSGYKAEGAKDAVGNVDWHSGVVNGQLPADRQRQVTLSRYSKVNRIVPDSEVAEMIAKQLEGTDIEIPYNVVTPAQRAELEKRGVKISDNPAGTVTEDINGNRIRQPMFFKTPDGHAYGFTYKGKIYIDPRIATSETPIHEYGHLWAEMKRQSAPEEWNNIKQALLGDKLIEPFIEKVKREYPELTGEGREDDFVEEVLTQFSGKHGAEKLRKMAQEIKAELGDDATAATIAEAAVRRVKSVLNDFWKGVCDLMGWQYTNAEDVADAVLRDMLKGVNPRERMKEASSQVKSQQEIEHTLMGVHNLSEEKLRKVLKQGGFANPSLAVVDTRNHMHTDYGEISLIPRSSMIDARTGRNAGTWTADAWTPTYPQVQKRMSDKGQDKYWAETRKSLGDEPGDIRSKTMMAFESWMENGISPERLSYWYLKERGKNPEQVMYEPSMPKEDIAAYHQAMGDHERFSELDEAGKSAVLALIAKDRDETPEEMAAKMQELKERNIQRMNDKSVKAFIKMRAEQVISDIDEYGVPYSYISDYGNKVRNAEKYDGKLNVDSTLSKAAEQVKSEGLEEDFGKWLDEKEKSYGIEEWLYNGTDSEGRQKWVRNTLENASRLMRNQGRNGAHGMATGNLIATVAKRVTTLDQIRKERGNLNTTLEEHEAFKEKWGDALLELCHKCGDDLWVGEARLQEALGEKNPVGHLKKEYGVELSKEDAELLNTFIKEVRENFPTGYFETKFERPVMLDEFSIAVVPETASPEIVKALKDAGLDVRTYDNTGSLEQQHENRRQATMDAVQGRDDIMFQKEPTSEPFKLSDSKKDAEGNSFYERKGSVDLWSASSLFAKAGRQDAPIRLTDRNASHIMESHGNVFKSEQDVFDFLDGVFGNATKLRKGRGRGMFVVVENDKTDQAAIIKLMPSETGDYYNVETAGYYRKRKWKDSEEVIADLSEPGQSDAAADASKPQVPDENGGELINTEAQTSSSEGKDTKNSDTLQGNEGKSSGEGQENENNSLKFQRVSPDSEMTPENEQYWKQWDAAMKKWKERNALPMDAQEPTERPAKNPDESMMDYVLRLANYNREKAMWQTAPKLEDYHMARDDKKVSEEARENEKRYPESEHAKRWRIATDLARIRHAMSRQKTYDKATVKAVTDFAQDFMKMGFGDNLRRGEMERMLSSVKNATGAKDIKKHVDTIMNILVDNQLRNLDQQIVKLSSIKELRQTAQGVERQGKLELKGQKMIQSFREARESRMTVEEIKERMAEVMENIVKHPDSDDMWEQEYEGLVIALQYAENIDGSRQEFKALDDEYKDAVKSYKESGRSYQAQQELLESLDKAMLENKMERIGSFGDIIGRLEGNIAVSIEGAKEYLEREKQRVKHIQEMANFDLAGKDMGAQRKDTKGKPANFFLQPLATFEQMLRQFGARNANGEGYLYNYFMRNWMDATDKAYLGEKQAKDELDAKAREVFGDKVKRWSDLYKIVMGLPTMDVEVADQGDKKTFTLTQGNLLYIYMANKMNDGAMKLRKMGIDEETVERIKDFLDPRLVELGDWLQDEYLPGKRVAYNKVHERMFGAPMAAIDHYFPIKILSDARVQEQDVNVPDSETLPSTITGNIIKRRKNALPLDILNTDALSLAIEHIEDMEHWAAQAEWNRDVNALLSYTTFRNKVKNMKTIYGSGDALWNTFKDAAKMAAGTYNSSAKSGHIDKTISNIAKGVTAAKIAFRVYTAFKQTLSAPAFLHDVDLGKFAKYSVNPYGSWKWAMENMPVFRKRWESRQVGDTRLMDDPTDWKMWKNDVVQWASRWGMSPNALVDGVTCAVGARAIYESRLEKYQKMGVDEETAKKRALQDAEIGYNLTQQSSEGAFVSAIQKDRTVAANMLSVFRNSSMAYTRQWVDASRNLKHRLQKGYKEDSIGFMQKQFEEQFGMDEEQARQVAEAEYARAGRHDFARLLNMMFGVTMTWNLGASLPYLLIGDDDDTKEEMLKDALLKGLIAGPSEGFAAGNIVSDMVGLATSESVRDAFAHDGNMAGIKQSLKDMGEYDINPLPLFADIEKMIEKLGYDEYASLQDLFNICMQSAVGVNPQTFTDMLNAIADYAAPGWDGTKYTWNPENMLRAKELALFIMRLANAPTSSWRNKYIDELDMDVEDAKKLSYDEMAKRYAHYKHWKDSPFMGWLRGEEGRQEKMEKIRKQFDKAYKERMDRQPDSELKNTFDDTSDADIRKQIAKLKAKSMEAKDAMGTTTSKDERTKEAVAYYAKHRTWQDMLDDLELEVSIRKLPEGDKKRKALEGYNKKIKELRNSLGRNAEEDSKRMESIRQARDKALQIVHNE